MNKYELSINTKSFKLFKGNSKKWEPCTINDFMESINGWQVVEETIAAVERRLDIFQGNWSTCYHIEGYDGYDWLDDPKNKAKITYYDKLCQFERTDYVAPYGWKQGYFNKEIFLKELEEKGIVRIPFFAVYDIQQYHKNYNGCYMEIKKI